MKKINLQRFKIKVSFKAKIALWAILFVILGFSIFKIVKTVNDFFNTNYLQFNRVVEVILNKPVEIRKREESIRYIDLLDYPGEIDTPLEIYICEKFGQYDCKTALAVAKAESGLKENAYGVNRNGTIDIGVFQVNEVHWDKPGCSPKELFDAESNVDCAYKLFQEQGWNPWVVYNERTYLNHY